MPVLRTDVCVVTFNRISVDARNFNFIRTFLDLGLSVITISLKDRTAHLPFIDEKFFPLFLNISEHHNTLLRLREFIQMGLRLANSISARYVLASDVYSLPIAKKIQKRSKAKLIYDSREIYSALASLEDEPTKQRLLTAFEKHYVKTVDNIIVTGELDREIIGERFPNKPIAIIKNYPSNIKITEPVDYRAKYKLPPDSIIILYQGKLLMWRGIERITSALKFNPRLYFVIVGDGEGKSLLYMDSLLYGINVAKRVIFAGEVPYFELANWTAGADIGAALIESITLSYKLALPNKLFEYCKAGIPVIASDLPAIRAVFERYPFGKAIDPDIRPIELASILLELYDNKDEYSKETEIAAAEFSWENQIQTIRELLV